MSNTIEEYWDRAFRIELLLDQAISLVDEDQYDKAQRLLSEAAELLDPEEDILTYFEVQSNLANARYLLGRDEEALTLYADLIARSNDPEFVDQTDDDEDMAWFVAIAYYGSISAARYMSEVDIPRLWKLVDDAERFLRDAAHEEWQGMIHELRGDIHYLEGKYEDARGELEKATAIRKRTPGIPGSTLSSILCQLGDVLFWLKEYPRAKRVLKSVWRNAACSPYERLSAAYVLAKVEYERDDLRNALHWASEAVDLSLQVEVPLDAELDSRALRARMTAEYGRTVEATEEAARLWRRARSLTHLPKAAYLFRWAQSTARVRLCTARQSVGLAPSLAGELEDQPQRLSALEQKEALKLLRSARHWTMRARPYAEKLDTQSETQEFEQELLDLNGDIEQLAQLLGGSLSEEAFHPVD